MILFCALVLLSLANGQAGCDISGWCRNIPGYSLYMLDCDGDGIQDGACYNQRQAARATRRSRNCAVDDWPGAPAENCKALFPGCSREYWCDDPSYEFEVVDCDNDGILDLVCRDPINGLQGTRRRAKQCADEWGEQGVVPVTSCPVIFKKCMRKSATWCTGPGLTYRKFDCDGDGYDEHICYDEYGGRAILRHQNNCADDWPNAPVSFCPTIFPAENPQPGWSRCASEGGSCTTYNNPTIIRYGSGDGRWTTLIASGAIPVTCTGSTFGVLSSNANPRYCERSLIDTTSFAYKWAFWDNGGVAEGTLIPLLSPAWWRYGAGTKWVYRLIWTRATCNAAFFGLDPVPGVTKTCVLGATAWQPPASLSVNGGVLVNPTNAPVKCANQNQNCFFYTNNPIKIVFYRSTGSTQREVYKMVVTPANTAVSCSTTFFGTDPDPSNTKECYTWSPNTYSTGNAYYRRVYGIRYTPAYVFDSSTYIASDSKWPVNFGLSRESTIPIVNASSFRYELTAQFVREGFLLGRSKNAIPAGGTTAQYTAERFSTLASQPMGTFRYDYTQCARRRFDSLATSSAENPRLYWQWAMTIFELCDVNGQRCRMEFLSQDIICHLRPPKDAAVFRCMDYGCKYWTPNPAGYPLLDINAYFGGAFNAQITTLEFDNGPVTDEFSFVGYAANCYGAGAGAM